MKMLFSDAPPDALDKLLSPRRKFVYGLFAFGPGTLLGLYLYSVKKRMERENETLRLQQVQSELSEVQEQVNKDTALANAIQEMRDRLRRLEEEALAHRQNAEKVANAADTKMEKERIASRSEMLTASESKIDAAIAVLKSPNKSDGKEHKTAAFPTALTSSLNGPQARRDKRHQEMVQQDVAPYLAKLKEPTK
ncbi:hypothetical protein PsorP6_009109 [Peronosclerospora sorghi]|uniref:Uncharacterized protein n=1 Tax=Peronosclerospora sorghi TaxID=230839 RepID=A0ACC0W0W0_9STRA|nr:hypothetical protein PsorP6_009109 [Peronosclerospora sorghi]